jgi:hypothetical protein
MTVTPPDQPNLYGASWSLDGGHTWQPFTTLPADSVYSIAIVRRDDPAQPIRFLVADGDTI